MPARKLAKEAGGIFFRLSGDPLNEIKSVGARMTDEWIASATKNGLNGKQLVEEARRLIKKYETE